MYAKYSIPAVVFSGQQHACLELFKILSYAGKAFYDAFRFLLILELLSYLNQFRYFFQLARQLVVRVQAVFERLLFFQDLLGISLIIPESRLEALILKFSDSLLKTRRVKDNLPLPRVLC